MGYMAFYARDPIEYAQRLEKLAEQGFNVISAGMLEDTDAHCFKWWAILEQKPAELELKEREDEAAGLLEAARKIANTCNGRDNCEGCPLARNGDFCVAVNEYGSTNLPENWRIIKGD